VQQVGGGSLGRGQVDGGRRWDHPEGGRDSHVGSDPFR
jgi:hypothetical protein